MIHDIRKAWQCFDNCQKIAEHLGFGGHWARLSLTRDKTEFSDLLEKFPEPYSHRPMLAYMYEGAKWLWIMQRIVEKRNMDSHDETTAKQALEHAIACFGFAQEQYAFLHEENCEAG